MMEQAAAVELTPERRAALLSYCRLESSDLTPEDNNDLEGMFFAAISYMAGAGIGEPDKASPRWHLYDLCVKAMVLDAWDRRGVTVNDRGTYTAYVDNPRFRQMLNQLKMTRPHVSESDTCAGGGPGCL